jgi:hypothetical protein
VVGRCACYFYSPTSVAHNPSHSGNAVGPGTERAVVEEALKIFTSDATYTRVINNEPVYYGVSLRPTPSSKDRLRRLKVFGTICALSIFWHRQGPDPVSPFLLKYAIDGLSSLMDLDFISCFAPTLADDLRPWPLDHTLPLSLDINSPLSTVVYTHLNMEVSIHCRVFLAMLTFYYSPAPLLRHHLKSGKDILTQSIPMLCWDLPGLMVTPTRTFKLSVMVLMFIFCPNIRCLM